MDIRPAPALQCKWGHFSKDWNAAAKIVIARYKPGDSKNIRNAYSKFSSSWQIISKQLTGCWTMQLHFTTITEVCGAFAPLYTQQTDHTSSALLYILPQKEPFTEILRVTSSLCGGPESHKPDIAEIWEQCNFILLPTLWNMEPLVSWNRRSIKMKVLTNRSMCSLY